MQYIHNGFAENVVNVYWLQMNVALEYVHLICIWIQYLLEITGDVVLTGDMYDVCGWCSDK